MEKEFVCKFCNKKFPSGKSLGGHIRIHSPKNNKKRLVDQREITTPPKQQHQCRVCGKSFCSLKALANHMSCHSDEGEKMVKMDTESAASETTTTTSSGPTSTMMKRSKNQSNSESFGLVSVSSDSDIDQGAKGVMFLHWGRERYNLALNSLAESSENKSEILETKSSSGEQLKTDEVSVAAADDDDSDDETASDNSDSDYFMNGPKKSDSGISVGGSLRNTRFGSFGFNSFNNGDELGVKEGGSKLSKSKRAPSYENDSSADTNSKIHRSSDGKSSMVKKASGADKNRKRHECPICFKVYSSGQALGGHKRSHTIADQQHRNKHNAADMQFDLNLPSQDDDDE